MKYFKKIDDNIEKYLLVFILSCMASLIVAQVFMRYLMQNSLTWSEELVRWFFVWFIWIGISYAFKEKKHVSVNVLINTLPTKVRKVIQLFVGFIMILFFLRLTYLGYQQITTPFISRQSSMVLYWFFSDTKVSFTWLYASLPLGAILSSYRLFQNFIQDIINFNNIDESELKIDVLEGEND